MSHSRVRVLTVAVLLLITYSDTTPAQKRRSGRTPAQAHPVKGSNDTQRAAPNGSGEYWAAQRSIEAAIQQLEAYLRESHNGDHEATARRQLLALRGLSLTASRPEWVRMDSPPLRHVPQWRVASVDPQSDRTRVTVEIDCPREDGGYCYFDPFDRRQLVLIDSAGQFYPMLEAGPLPADVTLSAEGRVALSGGRTISVMADFAPLSGHGATGQIYYRDRNRATPARFSLSHRK